MDTNTGGSTRRTTLLLVEDSLAGAKLVQDTLTAAGYDVRVARDGHAGLDMARETEPSLIISDIVMEGMDGFTLCRRIRADGVLHAVPVVLLTSLSGPRDVIRALECGADSFLTKPFDAPSLVACVENLLDAHPGQSADGQRPGIPVELAGAEHVITSGRQQILNLLVSTCEAAAARHEELVRVQHELTEITEKLEQRVVLRTAELAAAEARHRAVLEASVDGILVLAPSGRIRYANPAAEVVLGRSRATMIGELFEHDVPLGDSELLITRDAGDPLVVEVRASQTEWSQEQGRLLSLRDVTASRRQRAESEHQRELLYQSEKLVTMGQLLAGVAHELNNPLTVILSHTYLLREELGGGDVTTRLDQMQRAAERCSRIVKNFLALARRHPTERAQVDLNRVIEEVLELVAYPLRTANVEVRLDLDAKLPRVWADPGQMHQVVLNLVTNAYQAMRDSDRRRTITITSETASANIVRICVRDSGPGVPSDLVDSVFEPFFTTKSSTEGTGLGLHLCQAIAQAHGGGVRVAPDNGPEGAEFAFELKVDPRAAVRPAPRTQGPALLRKANILVVDDEPPICEVLMRILSGRGHYVDSVTSGHQALDRLAEDAFDLIICDIKMPGLDGCSLHAELQRLYPELCRRLVFMTGDGLGQDTKRFLEQVGLPLLQKPFRPDDVHRIVERAMAGLASRRRTLAKGEGLTRHAS